MAGATELKPSWAEVLASFIYTLFALIFSSSFQLVLVIITPEEIYYYHLIMDEFHLMIIHKFLTFMVKS